MSAAIVATMIGITVPIDPPPLNYLRSPSAAPAQARADPLRFRSGPDRLGRITSRVVPAALLPGSPSFSGLTGQARRTLVAPKWQRCIEVAQGVTPAGPRVDRQPPGYSSVSAINDEMPFGAASVTRRPVVRCCRYALRFSAGHGPRIDPFDCTSDAGEGSTGVSLRRVRRWGKRLLRRPRGAKSDWQF